MNIKDLIKNSEELIDKLEKSQAKQEKILARLLKNGHISVDELTCLMRHNIYVHVDKMDGGHCSNWSIYGDVQNDERKNYGQ